MQEVEQFGTVCVGNGVQQHLTLQTMSTRRQSRAVFFLRGASTVFDLSGRSYRRRRDTRSDADKIGDYWRAAGGYIKNSIEHVVEEEKLPEPEPSE